MEDLKKVISSKDTIIGAKVTLKKLRSGELKAVYLARNCPSATAKTIERYATLQNIPVVKLDIDTNELGIRAKKPYSISVLAQ